MPQANESILDLLNRLHRMVPTLIGAVQHSCSPATERCSPEWDCPYCNFVVLAEEIRKRKGQWG